MSAEEIARIDLHVEVPAVKFQNITNRRNGEPSATIRERVIAPRHSSYQWELGHLLRTLTTPSTKAALHRGLAIR